MTLNAGGFTERLQPVRQMEHAVLYLTSTRLWQAATRDQGRDLDPTLEVRELATAKRVVVGTTTQVVVCTIIALS
jgi:hypothetical protein